VKPPLKAARSPPSARSSYSSLEDLILRENVAALLSRQAVEGAVVALGDEDVGVVDDPMIRVVHAPGAWKRPRTWHGEIAQFRRRRRSAMSQRGVVAVDTAAEANGLLNLLQRPPWGAAI